MLTYMLHRLKDRSRQRQIARALGRRRSTLAILREGLIANSAMDAFYRDFPRVPHFYKETSLLGPWRLKVMLSHRQESTRLSLIVRTGQTWIGTLVTDQQGRNPLVVIPDDQEPGPAVDRLFDALLEIDAYDTRARTRAA